MRSGLDLTRRGGLALWQLRKVQAFVDAHLSENISNRHMADCVRLSPYHFARAFRGSTGASPHCYVIRRRIERAQHLMLSTNAPLSQIALDCGLADQSHFSRIFRRTIGHSPRAWRSARIGFSAAELMQRVEKRL
jgi:transcriptional regulator GlxA family with amidase domain